MRRLAPLLATLALTSCQGQQAVLGGGGRDQALFGGLWQVFLVVTLVFYVIVLAGLTWALLRRREGGDAVVRTGLLVWTGLISLTLVGLSIASWLVDRTMN